MRVDGTALKAVKRDAGPLGNLLEPKRGYRFAPENLTLGAALPSKASSVLDLGAGCGILGLLAGHELGADRVLLCERNPDMAALCRANAARYDAEVCHGDLRDFAPVERFDLVVANPPFYVAGRGRASENETSRDAMQALHGGLAEFVEAASRCVCETGLVVVLYPAESLAEVLVSAAHNGLKCAGLTFVFARHTERPFRVWVQLNRSGAAFGPTLVSPAALLR
ncbi:MAG: tRNA1(Val) A37 N6-methylase TrmN6 [Bradymonadia bacterium]|jgi:tRNA1(Val) A37 N6-methylase TrmN6